MFQSFHRVLFFFALLFSGSVLAQTSTTKVYDEVPAPKNMSRWSVEGDLQAHSVAGQGSPWLGIAGQYRIINWLGVGLRGFVPMSHTVDQSSYSIEGFSRVRFVQASGTDFFAEPSYAVNFYDFNPRTSYGLALGALSRITSGLSVGVSGGVELARYVVDSIGVENRSEYVVYPKVAFLANFNF